MHSQRIIDVVSRRIWGVIGGASLAAALAVWASSSLFIRAANPEINIRWQDSTDPAIRAALERRFKLRPAEQVAPNAWRYELTDASRETREALVRDTNVADTHFVDRTTFELWSDAPRGPRRPGPLGERWPRLALALVDRGPILLVLLAGFSALFVARPHTIPTRERVTRFLTRGIPVLSPREFAVFRFVFGIALLFYVYLHPFPRDVVPRALQRPDVQIGALAPMQWLAAHPAAVRAGQYAAVIAAALFAVGVLPRLLFAVAVAGTVQWLLALSLQADGHPFGVFLLPLLGLLVVPWHGAPPLWRIREADGIPDRRYGYAPWLLSLVLGIAWAGAAWAKLRDGPGWVLNGAVRYHFVTDYGNAHVDWGLAIATMPWLAIALSAGAVLIEGLTIAAAFVKPQIIRLAAGLAGMSVLVGFYLFQGLMWPAWWLLLLGFLPWHSGQRAADVPAHSGGWSVSRAQIAVIVALLAQQFVLSAAFLEFPPLVSRYDMYSKAHESPEAFDRENPGISRRIVAVDAAGTTVDVTKCPAVDKWRAYKPPDALPAAVAASACETGSVTPQRFVILESQCRFDWKAGHWYCPYSDKVIATIATSN